MICSSATTFQNRQNCQKKNHVYLKLRLSKEAASSRLGLWLYTVPSTCHRKLGSFSSITKTCRSDDHSSELVRVNDPKHQLARLVQCWNCGFHKIRNLFESCVHPRVHINFLRRLSASDIVHFGLKRVVPKTNEKIKTTQKATITQTK
jgi:hypothetical protein